MARRRRAPRRHTNADLLAGVVFGVLMIGAGGFYALVGAGLVDAAAWGFTNDSTGPGGQSFGPLLEVPPWVGGAMGLTLLLAGAVVAWGAVQETRGRLSGSPGRPVTAHTRSVAVLGLSVFVGAAFSLTGGVMALAGMGVIRAVGGGPADSWLMAGVGLFVVAAALLVTWSSVYRWMQARVRSG